jgi:hypothetical protein
MKRCIAHAAPVVALVLALAFVPIAVAAKGGKPSGGSSGSYTVTVSPGGPYSFGESIYITTNAPMYPNNSGPWISLACYQNGALVGGWTHAGFPSGWYYNWPYQLGPTQSWAGGAADCKVSVFHQSNNKSITDASTSFHVDG